MPRRPVVIVLVVAVAVAAAVLVVLRPWSDGDATRLEDALALAPESTVRFSWTDWAAVRDELDTDLSADSSAQDVREFLDAGFDADLTSQSSLVDSAETLQQELGVGPATVDWELLAQGEEGALLMVGLPGSYDLDALADRLSDAGYRHADGDGGVDLWNGGEETVAQLGDVSPQWAYLGVDPEQRVLVASDRAEYAAAWPGSARGSDDEDDVSAAAAAMGATVSASVDTGDYACGALAMTQADDAARTRAAELITAAGEVSPYVGYAIGLLPGGGLRVTMAFDTEDQARTNADSRAQLVAGPAPGQGGSFPDRFSVDEVVADGRVVRMDLDPEPGTYPLSDLATGPVLFATC